MQRAPRIVGRLQVLAYFALLVAPACVDGSSDDDGSSADQTDDGPPGDGDPGDGDPGDGDGDSGDGDGDSGDGDGDGDSGDGDGESGDGDGDPPIECGNGMLDPGEACDDGNNEPGDGCTAFCHAPGELIWEVATDLDGQLDDLGWAVAVDLDGNVNVVVEQDTGYALVRFDHDGEFVWRTESVDTERPSLILGTGGLIVAGGRLGSQGLVRAWDPDGALNWTIVVPLENSSILALARDGEGSFVFAGYHSVSLGYLARYDARGLFVWEQLQETAGALGPVAAGDRIWVERRDDDTLERYTLDGVDEQGINPVNGDAIADLVVDDSGNVYVLTEPSDRGGFSVSGYDGEGVLAWTQTHAGDVGLVSVGGLALLPGGGGLVIAGSTNVDVDASDGLLAFYDLDGESLAADVVIDVDDVDALHDVAVTPFNYAVAVGERSNAGTDANLWIRKFEI